jgi:predicted nucleic acid-binding Zn ribbon protein
MSSKTAPAPALYQRGTQLKGETMPDKLDLQGLTTKEIAEQYEKTRQEALKQRRFRASATHTQSAADSKGNTTSTFFGNVVG